MARAEISSHYRAYFGGAKDAKRGKLSFEPLDFRLLDATHALLIARYTVAPAGDAHQGMDRADQPGL